MRAARRRTLVLAATTVVIGLAFDVAVAVAGMRVVDDVTMTTAECETAAEHDLPDLEARARELVHQDLDGREDCQSGDASAVSGEVRARPADIVARMGELGAAHRDGSGYGSDRWTFRPDGSSRTYEVSVPQRPQGEFEISVHRRWWTWIG